jgi:hypothetical protein
MHVPFDCASDEPPKNMYGYAVFQFCPAGANGGFMAESNLWGN